jgi:hypothetical protein
VDCLTLFTAASCQVRKAFDVEFGQTTKWEGIN